MNLLDPSLAAAPRFAERAAIIAGDGGRTSFAELVTGSAALVGAWARAGGGRGGAGRVGARRGAGGPPVAGGGGGGVSAAATGCSSPCRSAPRCTRAWRRSGASARSP